MPIYAVNRSNHTKPVEITLELEQYSECMLPTIRVNNVAIAHFLPDGRLCIRNDIDNIGQNALRSSGMNISHGQINIVRNKELCTTLNG